MRIPCTNRHVFSLQISTCLAGMFSIAVVLLHKGGLEEIESTGQDSLVLLYHVCISNLISYLSLLITIFILEVNPDPFPSNV